MSDEIKIEGEPESNLPPEELLNLPEERLSEIAKGIIKNEIFTSDHIEPNAREQMIPMVFMCVAFGAFKDYTTDQLDQIGFLYANMSDAGPRGVNGYPMFFSMGWVTKHDAQIIWQKVKLVEKAMDVV